jgi:hypothetical protein
MSTTESNPFESLTELDDENQPIFLSDYPSHFADFDFTGLEELIPDVDELEQALMDDEMEEIPLDRFQDEISISLSDFEALIGRQHFNKVGGDKPILTPQEPGQVTPFTPLQFSMEANQHMQGPYWIFSKSDELRMTNDPNKDGQVVGRVKDGAVVQMAQLANIDPIDKAEYFSTTVGGKAQRGGFSMLLHAAVCHHLTESFSHILEPTEGHDVTLTNLPTGGSLSIEVTGQKWRSRSTVAKCIISKYLWLDCIMPPTEHYSTLRRWSWNEDQGKTDSFKQTGFDQGPSSMTSMVDIMHNYFETLPESTWAQFGDLVVSYHSTLPMPVPKVANRTFTTKMVEFSKLVAKRNKYPAPYRVIAPILSNLTNLDYESIKAKVVKNDEYLNGVHYSYHTLEHISESLNHLTDRADGFQQPKMVSLGYANAVVKLLSNYKMYQSYVIEQELFAKITGASGQFFSKYSQTGIIWKRTNNKYSCNFYQLVDPAKPKEVGEWVREKNGFFLSPCFKIASTDISYAISLPGRICSSFHAVWSLVSASQTNTLFETLAPIYSTWHNSSWLTSAIAANLRHIVPCFYAGTGDLPDLIDQSIPKMRTTHARHCDCVLISKFIDMMERYESLPENLTPLFGLPVQLTHLESDISIPMMWHIREASHDNTSPLKLIEGQKADRLQQQQRLLWLDQQVNLLLNSVSKGISQDEFNHHMSLAPDFPMLNFPYWLGISYLAKGELKNVGNRMAPSKFTLTQLNSDHFCHRIDDVNSPRATQQEKVANEFSRYFEEYRPKSAHDLIYKLSRSKQPQIFKLFSKDAKGSDREIPVMTFPMRCFQNMSESLLEAFNYEVESDLMIDSHRHSLVAKRIMFTLSKSDNRAIVSSQDKKFFSGYLFPELMSLCVSTAANACGSTSMVTSAACLRVNTSRKVIMPDGFTDFNLFDGVLAPYTQPFIIKKGQREILSISLQCEQHMMQGVGAAAGAVINTTFYLGFKEIMRRIAKFVKKPQVFTTSDDTVAMARISSSVDYTLGRTFFVETPINHLKHAMMVNSSKKQVDSTMFGEFNNKITFSKGMLPVSPIYAALNCQPLNQASPMADLILAINSARSGIFWGIPIDACQTALLANLIAFRIKWLVREEQFNRLLNVRLIPLNACELVEGFYPRSQEAVAICFNALRDDIKPLVLSGSMSLAHGLSSMRINQKGQHTRQLIKTGNLVVDSLIESIEASRLNNNRIKGEYIKIKSREVKLAATKRLMASMNERTIEESLYQQIQSVHAPLKAHIITKRATNYTMQPRHMGVSTSKPQTDITRVLAARFTGTTYRVPLSQSELEASKLPESDFKKWYNMRLRESVVQGLSFESPFGLPLIRSCDLKLFLAPTCYNFTFTLEPYASESGPEVYEGVVIQDFKPCLWGRDSLRKNASCRLAYGSGYLDGQFYMFVQRDKRKIKIKNDDRFPHYQTELDGDRYACCNKHDFDPIDLQDLGSDVVPENAGLIGDPTAILNYGGWIKSSHPSGFAAYQTLYSRRRCELPASVIRCMPSYPFFSKKATEINLANSVRLIGSSSIFRLKLIEPMREDVVHIDVDLTGFNPMLKTEDIHIDDESDFQ